MPLQVAFKLFGFIPGSVGLRGRLEPVGSNEDTVVSASSPEQVLISILGRPGLQPMFPLLSSAHPIKNGDRQLRNCCAGALVDKRPHPLLLPFPPAESELRATCAFIYGECERRPAPAHRQGV